MRVFTIALMLAFWLAWGMYPFGVHAQDANPIDEKIAREQAVSAAVSWLALVDSEKYAESWEEAAPLFQSHVDKADWVQAVNALRGPMGTVEERSIMRSVHVTELPGAPDGHYVVIQYATTFEYKKESVETVTPMLTDDGTWRVSGYYLK